MRATITIKTAEIETATKEYVERQGWTVDSAVELTHSTDDDRGMTRTTYSASVDVKPNKGPSHP